MLWINDKCSEFSVIAAESEVFMKGGRGGIALAEAVLEAIGKGSSKVNFAYEFNIAIKVKIEK